MHDIHKTLHSISDHLLAYKIEFKAGFSILIHAYGCIDHFMHIDGSFVTYINFIWQNGRIIVHVPADRILTIELVGFLDSDQDEIIFSDGRLL